MALRHIFTLLLASSSVSLGQADMDHHAIQHLPGVLPGEFSGSVKHFSGHLVIKGGFKVFYYFTQHPDPARPLIVWMNGGPGASSLMGLFGELGPFLLNSKSNTSEGLKPFTNPHGFNHEGSLLAWEQPAGIGFSQCPSEGCPMWDDDSSALANMNFLLAFFDAFPQEKSRALFLTGESYAGIYVPLLAEHVREHNSVHGNAASPIRLQGIAVGDGCIGFEATGGCGRDSLEVFVSFLERAAPDVDRQVLANTRSICGSELSKGGQAASDFTPQCQSALKTFFDELGPFNTYHWSSPCGPEGQGNWGDGTAFACGTELAQDSYFHRLDVQKAIHAVDENATEPISWKTYDGDWPGYNISRPDVVSLYSDLMANGHEVLIYNGLRDSAVSYPGAEHWTAQIGGAVQTPRRKWADTSGAFAGHVTHFAGASGASQPAGRNGSLTFATVVGSGHLVPGDRPKSARSMIAAFVKGQPLPEYSGLQCERYWLGRGYGNFCAPKPQVGGPVEVAV